MNVLALCSGVGGLELGVKLACPAATAVCYVEREAYAAAVLVERMAILGLAPIWSDLVAFDGTPWRGAVDLVTAGYPCQPFSNAGRRRGTADERYIWPDIARIISEVQPGLIFLENVAAHVRVGFDRTLTDLAAFGYDAVWGCYSTKAGGVLIGEIVCSVLLPTPTASEYKRGYKPQLHNTGGRKNGVPLQHWLQARFQGEYLNPYFLEWMMGWPIGWTALEPQEMEFAVRLRALLFLNSGSA